jgi:hypothetical protein
MVMYCLLTGGLPFAGKSDNEIMGCLNISFKVSKSRLEKKGISEEDQREEWLEDNPLDARRPDMTALRSDTPAPLGELMQQCWQDAPGARPAFVAIKQSLALIMLQAAGGGGSSGGDGGDASSAAKEKEALRKCLPVNQRQFPRPLLQRSRHQKSCCRYYFRK